MEYVLSYDDEEELLKNHDITSLLFKKFRLANETDVVSWILLRLLTLLNDSFNISFGDVDWGCCCCWLSLKFDWFCIEDDEDEVVFCSFWF